MSNLKYTKHNWESGDILFADQLNEIDNQIALNEENIQSKLGKNEISLGLHFDGKYYVFANGNPVGEGVAINEKGTSIEEVEYTFDGDRDNPNNTWVVNTSNDRFFVKVGDIPKGKMNFVGGAVNVTVPANSWRDYDFTITQEMLDMTYDFDGVLIPATVNGLTQIFYQDTPTNDFTVISTVIICTKPGIYDIGFNGWMECITFTEKGIYFADNRGISGGNKYTSSFTFTTIVDKDDDEDESPIDYSGNQIKSFTRGICIGDSITEGVFNHNDGESVIKKYSYPSNLRRITGLDVVNAGIAGLTSETWYQASLNSGTQYGKWVNNEWNWSESPSVGNNDVVSSTLDYSGFDFAIIHLGINDIGFMGSNSIDTVVSNFETNINNIINKLKTANKGIKVFLCTIIPCYAVPGNPYYSQLNDKIREMASTLDNVFLVDLNVYSECVDGTAYENSHLTAIGYNKMASEIVSIINYTMNKNLDKFKDIQFIGTSYTI